jgi:SOS-response transcriptional repressor LexA
MIGLTERQRLIYEYILATISDRGRPPTLREMARPFEVASTNGCADHLTALARKGWIVLEHVSSGGCRVIRIPGVRWQMVAVDDLPIGTADMPRSRDAAPLEPSPRPNKGFRKSPIA